MTIDLKTIAVFLPFVAAALLGITYASNGRILSTVSLPTYLLIYCLAGVAVALALHSLTSAKINFAFINQKPIVIFVAASVISSIAAWSLVLLATREISPIYAAAGEIAYPIFTVIFSYLLFQSKNLDWSTAIGGSLIMVGALVVTTGKLKVGG